MTKEEVYRKHHVYAEFDLVPNKESALSAMDEYAKQQAIAFMNWSLQSECPYYCADENEWTNTIDLRDTITTEQLHDKFLEHQNKSNG